MYIIIIIIYYIILRTADTIFALKRKTAQYRHTTRTTYVRNIVIIL